MECCDQSQGIDMQCTTLSSLRTLKGWRSHRGLVFDESGRHHGNSPWRGELASPRLAYLTLPIPHPLICFWGLRNALLFLILNIWTTFLPEMRPDNQDHRKMLFKKQDHLAVKTNFTREASRNSSRTISSD